MKIIVVFINLTCWVERRMTSMLLSASTNAQ